MLVQNLNLEMSQLKEENKSNLGHFVQGGIQALQNLQITVTDEQIENAALILAKSNVVHIVAQRKSFPIAAYLTYAFRHLGVANMLLDSVGGMFADQGKTIVREMFYLPSVFLHMLTKFSNWLETLRK